MANIKKLQLNGEDIIPITHESAVIDDNGISIVDKYQTKEDQNLDTNNKTIIGAINELNINNVHLGNALGAVEYDDNDNPIIERLDDLESSLIKLIGSSSNNDNIINDLNNQINELEDNIENTRNTLAGLMTEGGYDITGDEDINSLLDLLILSGISVGDIKQISCRYAHVFILKYDGSLWGCGDNEYGQLGLGDVTQTTTFTRVTTNINNDVKQVSCGYRHTFILKKDGSVWSCGYNEYGQLGLGSSGSSANKTTFTKVTTNIDNDVKQIACGYSQTFIIKNNGTLWSCGYNKYGQLGLGDNTDRTTFVQVTSINDIKQIACGQYHEFILKNDETLWACGDNEYGQLGLDNVTEKNIFTQVTININNDVNQIAYCGYHTYIIKNDGSVWSCGYNYYGQLGLGTSGSSTNQTTFTQVTTNINNDVKQISCGTYHTFIIKNDGSVWSCGRNNNGQLGLGNTTTKTTFTKVTKNISNDVKQIACGYNCTFIIKNDGSVWSCGYNNKGQLGLNDTTDKTSFTMIPRRL